VLQKGYTLLSASGAEFDSSPYGSLPMQVANKNINPQTPYTGTLVFDVPSGVYDLVVSEHGLQWGFFGLSQSNDRLLRCSLGQQ
jgi:hypothetical protein